MRRRKKIYNQYKNRPAKPRCTNPGSTQTNPKPVTITIVLFFPCPKET
jgi:hypothetical protein